jgi:diacylglycerol kinase (ATP)
MKASIIINPFAGKRRHAPRVRRLAEKLAADLGVSLSVKMIEGPGHGSELARAAVGAGAERVLCAGGDGTLNAVATGLIGTRIPLGVVPMGSGNGYSRSLGLPQKAEEALWVALTGTPRPMDVGYLNDRPFLGTAGVGFDARVADRFDRSKRRGMIGYLQIILEEIARAGTVHVRVTANGRTTETDVLMLVFCNTREFGNGARISPGSRPDDGVAELKLVSKPPVGSLPLAFIGLYTNRADRLRYIRSILTAEAQVVQHGTLAHLDGEPIAIGHNVRFRLEPHQLPVVVS